MKDDTQHRPSDAVPLPGGDIRVLARKAITVLASGASRPGGALDKRLDRLCDAFLSDDDDLRHDAIVAMRGDDISAADIIDHIVPATARLIGDRWFADRISFADVTIATARLQEAVRALSMVGQNGQRRPIPAADGPAILLIIPRVEHHTLGAFICADQFRRLGYRVDIAIDQHPRQIAVTLRQKAYAMVCITASGRRTLASATELVNMIRTTVTRVTPIVLGGAVLDLGKGMTDPTGADHVARDVQSALRVCGLSLALRGSSPQERDGGAGADRVAVMRTER